MSAQKKDLKLKKVTEKDLANDHLSVKGGMIRPPGPRVEK
jgi:hypothetical protein